MKIVLVDDDEVNLTFLSRNLQDYEVFTFRDPKKALKFCQENPFDLVLTDMRMPNITGLGLLREIREKTTDFVSIIISAYTDVDYMMDAVNANILFAYLLKPTESPALQKAVKDALRHLQLTREKRLQDQEIAETARLLQEENNRLKFQASSPLAALVGQNPTVLKIKEQIKAFVSSDFPILIWGEEGTGKKTVARILHEMSGRRNKPLITLSCTTIPSEMLEIELFGSDKNPAKGLKTAKNGFLDSAHGSTLLLEDIQELPKPLQSKFLKFLQYGTYYPAGSTVEKSADVRVFLTSSTSLIAEMEKGDFRKELYFKIANLQIKVPPLRERREDILAILEVLSQRKKIALPPLDRKETELLTRYAYPGNIRELEGILEKMNLVTRSSKNGEITAVDIENILKENAKMYALAQGEHAVVRTIQLPSGQEPFDLRAFVDELEKEIIISTLRYNDHNISATSRALQISRQGLKNKIKRFEIPVNVDDDDSVN
jgi:DNA-binding NtrC family response regulator